MYLFTTLSLLHSNPSRRTWLIPSPILHKGLFKPLPSPSATNPTISIVNLSWRFTSRSCLQTGKPAHAHHTHPLLLPPAEPKERLLLLAKAWTSSYTLDPILSHPFFVNYLLSLSLPILCSPVTASESKHSLASLFSLQQKGRDEGESKKK